MTKKMEKSAKGRLALLGLIVALSFGQVPAGARTAGPLRGGAADSETGRVDVKLNAEEAANVLAILDRAAAGRPVDDALWRRLLSCEPYVRLKKREEEIAVRFNSPDIKLTDEAFRKFVLSGDLAKRAPELAETLAKWEKADLAAAGERILSYLPAGARIRAKVFPMIKPRRNSFVFDLAADPTIFLYLDPAVSGAEFENTVAHEMHHIGYAGLDPLREKAQAGAPAKARPLLEWIGAFGEGFAMLAAAGGPDVHPHASSPAEIRARWDRDMGRFNADLADVERFFLDVLNGRLKSEAEITEKGSSFFGVQGPWYTVGYRMAVMIEKAKGKDRLLQCMLDPRLLLLDYNSAAAEYNRAHKDALALWSPELLRGLGLDAGAKD